LDVVRIGFGMRSDADDAQRVIQNAHALSCESGHSETADRHGSASENRAA
jgi:hypothetical protein